MILLRTYPSTSYSDEPHHHPPKQDIEMNTITSTNDIQRLAHCVLKKKKLHSRLFCSFFTGTKHLTEMN